MAALRPAGRKKERCASRKLPYAIETGNWVFGCKQIRLSYQPCCEWKFSTPLMHCFSADHCSSFAAIVSSIGK